VRLIFNRIPTANRKTIGDGESTPENMNCGILRGHQWWIPIQWAK